MQRVATQVSYNDGRPPETLVLPLELKTGTTFGALAHRAQVTYYCLLMSDRYGMRVGDTSWRRRRPPKFKLGARQPCQSAAI